MTDEQYLRKLMGRNHIVEELNFLYGQGRGFTPRADELRKMLTDADRDIAAEQILRYGKEVAR